MKRRRLEADLRQYFNISLRDIYDDNSPLTVRELCCYVEGLPAESRVYKLVSEDPWDTKDHLLATVADLLIQIHFQSSMTAAGTVGDEYQEAMENRPKPIDRPGQKWQKLEEKKVEFTSVRKATGLLKKRKTQVIHIKGICSEKNLAAGECGCPRVDVTDDANEKERIRAERRRLAGDGE